MQQYTLEQLQKQKADLESQATRFRDECQNEVLRIKHESARKVADMKLAAQEYKSEVESEANRIREASQQAVDSEFRHRVHEKDQYLAAAKQHSDAQLELQNRLNTAEIERTVLQTQVSTAEALVAQANARAGHAEQEVSRLQSEVQSLQVRIATGESQMTSAAGRYAQLEAQLGAVTAGAETLKTENARLVTDLACARDAEAHVRKQEQETVARFTSAAEVQKKVTDSLRLDCDKYMAEVSRLNGIVATATTATASGGGDVSVALRASQAEVARLTQEVHRLGAEVTRVDRQGMDLAVSLDKANAQVVAVSNEKANLTTMLANTQSQVTIEQRIADRKVEETKMELRDAHSTELEQKAVEIEQLESVIESLQTQIQEFAMTASYSLAEGEVSVEGAGADTEGLYDHDWSDWGAAAGGVSAAQPSAAAPAGAPIVGGVSAAGLGAAPGTAVFQAAGAGSGPKEIVQVQTQDENGKVVNRNLVGTEVVQGTSEVIVRKVNEADKVVVPKFPKIVNIKQWRIGVCRGLCTASGRIDSLEIYWFMEATDGTKTFEQLSDSGEPRYQTLDQKLAVALLAIIKADCQILSLKVQTLEEEAIMQGKLLKGRQLAWLIFDYFRLNADMTMLYNLEDIVGLSYPGDNRIHEFYRLWMMMVKECEVQLPERTLRHMLVTKLEKSKKLEPDIAYFHRLPDSDPQKTYQYLLHCMERQMSREGEDKNRIDRKDLIRSANGTGRQAALPAKGAAKGNGKDKDKNKDKGKGKGKDKGKDKRGRSTSRGGGSGGGNAAGAANDANRAKAADGRFFCWFHNNGGCTRNPCNFSHDTPPKAVKDAMTRPSRSQSPGGKGPGKGKSKAKAKACPAPPEPVGERPERANGGGGNTKKFGGMKALWCAKFLAGKCPFSDDQCPFPHISKEAKAAIQAAIQTNKAAGNDRG